MSRQPAMPTARTTQRLPLRIAVETQQLSNWPLIVILVDMPWASSNSGGAALVTNLISILVPFLSIITPKNGIVMAR
jgi:hypothetical protein